MIDTSIADQLKLISTTEQAQFLTPERIAGWVEAVQQVDPDRLPWHVKRLFGFGGSEVGVLVAERSGLVDPFESARSICASKLMLGRPDEAIPAMERGQYMEPVVQKLFMDKFREFGIEQDEKSMIAMSRAIGYRSWQNGSPDDVVLMGKGKRKKRFIVDYKAPGTGGYEVDGVPMRYSAQLHHYEMIAKKLGIKIDGLILVAIDYSRWTLETLNVPFDQYLVDEILDAGDYFWNEYVMQGRLPDFARKQLFDKSKLHDGESIERDALDFLTFKRMGDASHFKAGVLQDRLKSVLGRYKVGDARLQFAGGLINVSAKRKFDVEGAREALGPVADEARLIEWDGDSLAAAASAAGVDVEPYKRPSEEYDEESLRELIRAAKLNVDAYETEALTFALPRVKKGPVAERLNVITDAASGFVVRAAPKLRTKIQQTGVSVSTCDTNNRPIAPVKQMAPAI
jgi:predicted phage-related endonuclease